MDNDTLPYLPPEVIISILLRLPVKSLMRFRCVCKEWKNLFKTPSFVAEHLHHSTKQNSLLFDCTIYGCTLSLLNHEMQVLELQKPPFIDTSMGSYRIVYSNNGLLCVELINVKPSSCGIQPLERSIRFPKLLNLLNTSIIVV
ncbi:F-box protein At5g49610-like [Neltuma alba]|uniref:F-box protein At5g49610-like n=1 Tax=Neltuma alba TaxID=207710 RepID=UPI0010A31762|nr:F-box protein At5g49610-like [Prosopis alba]